MSVHPHLSRTPQKKRKEKTAYLELFTVVHQLASHLSVFVLLAQTWFMAEGNGGIDKPYLAR
jgi:hypothetical protein